MNNFCILTAIRTYHGQPEHRILVPHSTPTDIERRRTAKDAGVVRAPFACPVCGLVSLYSALDLYQFQFDIGCPYIAGTSALLYVAAECGDSNCGALTNIHAIWDVPANKFAGGKPPSGWTIGEDVRCSKCAGPLKAPLVDHERCIGAKMPF
jgi:hypothetical protein